MGEFNKAFIAYCDFILKYKAKFVDFSGNVYGRFKVGNNEPYHKILCQFLDCDALVFEHIMSNIVKLYGEYYFGVEFLKVDPVAVQLLDCFLAEGFFLGPSKFTFNSKEMTTLTNIRKKFSSPFVQPPSNASISSAASFPASNNSSGMSSSHNQAVGFESLHAMIEKLTNSVSTINTRLSNVELNHAGKGNYSNNPSFEDIGVDEVLGLKIENIINKKQRFESHISIFETHLQRETTPASLLHIFFPKPLLWDDPDYIDIHNKRIMKWQKEMLNEDIEYLKKTILSLESEVLSMKSEIGGNANKVIVTIEKAVENSLVNFKNKATAKCLNLVAGKYKVKTKNHNPSNNSDSDGDNLNNSNTPNRENKRKRNNNTPINNGFNNRRGRNSKNYRSNYRNNNYNGNKNQSDQQYNPKQSNRLRSSFKLKNPQLNSNAKVNFDLTNNSSSASYEGDF